jgi:hypothetical protein
MIAKGVRSVRFRECDAALFVNFVKQLSSYKPVLRKWHETMIGRQGRGMHLLEWRPLSLTVGLQWDSMFVIGFCSYKQAQLNHNRHGQTLIGRPR